MRVAANERARIGDGEKPRGPDIGQRRNGAGRTHHRLGIGSEEAGRDAGAHHHDRADGRNENARPEVAVRPRARTPRIAGHGERRERQRGRVLPGMEAGPRRHHVLREDQRHPEHGAREGERAALAGRARRGSGRARRGNGRTHEWVRKRGSTASCICAKLISPSMPRTM